MILPIAVCLPKSVAWSERPSGLSLERPFVPPPDLGPPLPSSPTEGQERHVGEPLSSGFVLFFAASRPVETREQGNHTRLTVNGIGTKRGAPWRIAGDARR